MSNNCQSCKHYHVPPRKTYHGVNVGTEDIRLCTKHARWMKTEPGHYCGEFEVEQND